MRTFATLFAAALFAASTTAAAADYPSRTITMISPFPAGSAPDVAARLVCEQMAIILKKPCIVESKPGDNGRIAVRAVLREPADGHTVFFAWDGMMSINPAAYLSQGCPLPYDPRRDFVPLGLVLEARFALLVNDKSPARDVRGIVEYARANPGRLAMAVVSPSSVMTHALLTKAEKVDIVSVPMLRAGAPQALQHLVSNEVQMHPAFIPGALGLVRSGKLTPIGLIGKERDAALPDTPTFGEQGFRTFDEIPPTWAGLVVASGTPAHVLPILADALKKALDDRVVADRLTAGGNRVRFETGDQMKKRVEADISALVKVLKSTETILPGFEKCS